MTDLHNLLVSELKSSGYRTAVWLRPDNLAITIMVESGDRAVEIYHWPDNPTVFYVSAVCFKYSPPRGGFDLNAPDSTDLLFARMRLLLIG